METLYSPFTDWMIKIMLSNFLDIIIMGKMVEPSLSRKITHSPRKSVNPKKSLELIKKKGSLTL